MGLCGQDWQTVHWVVTTLCLQLNFWQSLRWFLLQSTKHIGTFLWRILTKIFISLVVLFKTSALILRSSSLLVRLGLITGGSPSLTLQNDPWWGGVKSLLFIALVDSGIQVGSVVGAPETKMCGCVATKYVAASRRTTKKEQKKYKYYFFW